MDSADEPVRLAQYYAARKVVKDLATLSRKFDDSTASMGVEQMLVKLSVKKAMRLGLGVAIMLRLRKSSSGYWPLIIGYMVWESIGWQISRLVANFALRHLQASTTMRQLLRLPRAALLKGGWWLLLSTSVSALVYLSDKLYTAYRSTEQYKMKRTAELLFKGLDTKERHILTASELQSGIMERFHVDAGIARFVVRTMYELGCGRRAGNEELTKDTDLTEREFKRGAAGRGPGAQKPGDAPPPTHPSRARAKHQRGPQIGRWAIRRGERPAHYEPPPSAEPRLGCLHKITKVDQFCTSSEVAFTLPVAPLAPQREKKKKARARAASLDGRGETTGGGGGRELCMPQAGRDEDEHEHEHDPAHMPGAYHLRARCGFVAQEEKRREGAITWDDWFNPLKAKSGRNFSPRLRDDVHNKPLLGLLPPVLVQDRAPLGRHAIRPAFERVYRRPGG